MDASMASTVGSTAAVTAVRYAEVESTKGPGEVDGDRSVGAVGTAGRGMALVGALRSASHCWRSSFNLFHHDSNQVSQSIQFRVPKKVKKIVDINIQHREEKQIMTIPVEM